MQIANKFLTFGIRKTTPALLGNIAGFIYDGDIGGGILRFAQMYSSIGYFLSIDGNPDILSARRGPTIAMTYKSLSQTIKPSIYMRN